MRLEWQGNKVFAQCKDVVEKKLKEGAELVARDAKATVRPHRYTGNLEDGIKVYKSKFPDGGYIVASEGPHTHLVELGTRGDRSPKKGKIMFWIDKRTGKEIVARKVKKMPRMPFMRPALHKNEEKIRQSFWDAVK